ncbi:unnamed protein product [Gordionus sp. m RMFG-2023]|uniref:complexin-like n=1 Tax=Gordionus sp. m RMFG-2023 TaxID=3053472 RepID=UPI0030E5BA63
MDFVAKQVLSSKLGGVKGELGKLTTADKEPSEEEMKRAAEIEEARKEAEEKRKEKHKKMEAERENMRSGIRTKYNLKKKEIPVDEEAASGMSGLGRKRKTQEELAKENQIDEDKPIIEQITDQITQLTDRTTKAFNEQCSIT